MLRTFIFDIDGTLTPPRQPMTAEFFKFFKPWCGENNFYLVTGSDFEKVKEQVPLEILRLASGIFCCMGNELFEKAGQILVYRNSFEPSRDLIRTLEHYVDSSCYPVGWRRPPHIEYRTGMVNFSTCGRGSTQAGRLRYKNFDQSTLERRWIQAALKRKFQSLEVSIGGEISLDIYPKGGDKSQSLGHILEKDPSQRLIFIGDKAFQGGNDYEICKMMDETCRGTWFNVSGWVETKAILKQTQLVNNKDVL